MRYYILSVFLITILSCRPSERVSTIYPRFPIHKPSIEAKGSLAVALDINSPSSDTNAVAWSTTLAYSPLKHLGVIGSFYHQKGKMTIGSNVNFLIGEIGLGAYYPIEFGQTGRSKFLWELYAGYNRGKGSDNQEFGNLGVLSGHENAFSHFNAKFHGHFIQLGFGMNYFNERLFHFKLGGIIKFAKSEYFEIKHTSNFESFNLELPTFSTVNIGFDLKMGRNLFLAHLRFGLIFPYNFETKKYFDMYSGNYLRIGAYAGIGVEKIFKIKNKKNT